MNHRVTTDLVKAQQTCARLDDSPPACWCGQDLEHARTGHCPRCGVARPTPTHPVTIDPAA